MLSSNLMSLVSLKNINVNLNDILTKTKSDINNMKQFLSALINYVNDELRNNESERWFADDYLEFKLAA